jgi:hypothetical protein
MANKHSNRRSDGEQIEAARHLCGINERAIHAMSVLEALVHLADTDGLAMMADDLRDASSVSRMLVDEAMTAAAEVTEFSEKLAQLLGAEAKCSDFVPAAGKFCISLTEPKPLRPGYMDGPQVGAGE